MQTWRLGMLPGSAIRCVDRGGTRLGPSSEEWTLSPLPPPPIPLTPPPPQGMHGGV